MKILITFFMALTITNFAFAQKKHNDINLNEIENKVYTKKTCQNILVNGVMGASNRADQGYKTETPVAIERWSNIMANYATVYNIFCKNK